MGAESYRAALALSKYQTGSSMTGGVKVATIGQWESRMSMEMDQMMEKHEYVKYREDYARYLREFCGDKCDDWKYTNSSPAFKLIIDAISRRDTLAVKEFIEVLFSHLLPQSNLGNFAMRYAKDGFELSMENLLRERIMALLNTTPEQWSQELEKSLLVEFICRSTSLSLTHSRFDGHPPI